MAQYPNRIEQGTVVISSGQTESTEIDLNGTTLVGVMTPATITSTTLTFKAALTSGGTFNAVTGTSGSAISYTISAGKYFAIDPKDFHGVRYLKLVGGSSEGADRTLTVLSKSL